VVVGIVVVAVLAVAAGSLAGLAGAQTGGNVTGVDSCRTIDASGTYVLTENVTGGDGNCLTITASNVTLDGAGHSLQGTGSGHAIHANGTAHAVENVTVRRVQASNWSVGVFYLGVEGSTIRGTVAETTPRGSPSRTRTTTGSSTTRRTPTRSGSRSAARVRTTRCGTTSRSRTSGASTSSARARTTP